MKKTKHHSWIVGKMPKGCQLCVEGRKEVLFITGICPKHCFFCPISDEKKDKDVIYANEWPIKKFEEILEEAKLCSSKGTGITGGDPLAKLDRTIKAITMLKKEFGKEFHIHLYTPLILVTKEILQKLEKAGLDEIRFHPDLDDDSLWYKIEFETTMEKGIEIPVIPNKEKETIKLIDFIKDKVKFLNLNELEFSDAKANKVTDYGYETKDDISYGIKGSEDIAKKLLRYCEKNTKLNIHYCPVKLKDRVQMTKRLKLRAQNVAKPFDKISKDNTLLRGAIYLPEFQPDFGFTKKLKELKNKEEYIKKLKITRTKLIKLFGIDPKMIEVDKKKIRLITSKPIVQQLAKYLKKKQYVPYWVEDDPTYDQTELESQPL